MNNASRYFCVDGRENWAGVAQLARYRDQWEGNAEAICSVDAELFETYSYHPGPWLPLSFDDRPSVGMREDKHGTTIKPVPRKPLTVEQYAAAWGLVPLAPKLYWNQGLGDVSAHTLRKRASAGEFGSYILYGRNRYLVRPEVVATDIEKLKAEKRRWQESFDLQIHWSNFQSPVVWRVVPKYEVPEPTIRMRCSDCDVQWTTAGSYANFCPQCYRQNVSAVKT